MDPATKDLIWSASILASLIIAGVTGVIQLFNGWRSRLSADRLNLRDIAFKAAVAEWEFQRARNTTETEEASRHIHPKPPIHPVETFDYILIKKLKMLNTFGDGDISRKGLEEKFSRMVEFHDFFREHYAAAQAKGGGNKS